MGKVIRPFCWHQNSVPWGLSAPAPGLYTCIKSWKKLYKISLQRHYFETCNKWMKWQDISVDIKTLPRGHIHVYMYKIMKKICIKSDFKEIFLKLIANDQSDKRFLLTSKFCPLGLSAPELQLFSFKWWPWVDLDHFYDRVKFFPDASVWVTAYRAFSALAFPSLF